MNDTNKRPFKARFNYYTNTAKTCAVQMNIKATRRKTLMNAKFVLHHVVDARLYQLFL